MSAEGEKTCSQCGGVIPEGSVHCPACALGRAMGGDDSLGDLPKGSTTGLDVVPVTEGEGDSIGAYKLLEKIGEGGFGVVYMAKQSAPVRRQVALKIIKLGMDTKQVVGRFEAERQALAMMEHPNIAKVLDAGSTDAGRPYFVMELVHGVPITEFCNENRLTTEERLELFVKVCHAVQHAHQKGIIHRDLKPSNILVTMHDDEAVPKVIDFGIAKATQHDLTDKTLFTQFRHFLGTPAYMSPEQAQMSGLGVDTRSDIYSLGVLLYELLTGCTPLDLKPAMESGYDEVRRTIREEEPLKPSAFVSQLSAPKQTTLLKQSRASAGSLHSQLRGDLDWIVMRAIEKDRTRRYETANLFARDVELFLCDEPVSAVVPSAWYLLSKVVRRHKPVFAALALVLPLLVIATGVSLFLYLKALNSTRNLLVMKEHLQSEIDEREMLNIDLRKTNENLEKAIQRERLGRYAADIAAAHTMVQKLQFGKANRVLDRYRPTEGKEDVREFCWYYLKDTITRRQGERLGVEGTAMAPEAFSPDGRWLLGKVDYTQVEVWDVTQRRKIISIDLPETFALTSSYFGSFSPDGRYLMIREIGNRPEEGREFEVLLWRINGKRFEPLPSTHYQAWPSEERSNVSSAAVFLPGTSILLLVGNREPGDRTENDVAYYDLESAQIVKNLRGAGTILDVSPNGKFLVTQRWRQKLPETVIWDTETGAALHREVGLTDRYLNFFGPDQILVTRHSGEMELRDVRTLELLDLPVFPVNRVDKVYVFGDSPMIGLKKYYSPGFYLWNPETERTYFFEDSNIHPSPTGEEVAYRMIDGGIGLMSIEALDEVDQIDQVLLRLAFTEQSEVVLSDSTTGASYAYRLPRMDASRLVSQDRIVGYEGEGVFWTRSVTDDSERRGGVVRREGATMPSEIEVDPLQSVRIRPLGKEKLFLRYRRPDKLEVRDRESLDVIRSREFAPGSFRSQVGQLLVENGTYVPSWNRSDRLRFLSTDTLKIIDEREPIVDDYTSRIVHLEGEGRLVLFTRAGTVREYSISDRQLVIEYELGPDVFMADLSSDGRTIAVMRRHRGAGAIELLDRKSKLSLMSIEIEDRVQLRKLRFSPDGTTLLAPIDNYFSKPSLRWFAAPR